MKKRKRKVKTSGYHGLSARRGDNFGKSKTHKKFNERIDKDSGKFFEHLAKVESYLISKKKKEKKSTYSTLWVNEYKRLTGLEKRISQQLRKIDSELIRKIVVESNCLDNNMYGMKDRLFRKKIAGIESKFEQQQFLVREILQTEKVIVSLENEISGLRKGDEGTYKERILDLSDAEILEKIQSEVPPQKMESLECRRLFVEKIMDLYQTEKKRLLYLEQEKIQYAEYTFGWNAFEKAVYSKLFREYKHRHKEGSNVFIKRLTQEIATKEEMEIKIYNKLYQQWKKRLGEHKSFQKKFLKGKKSMFASMFSAIMFSVQINKNKEIEQRLRKEFELKKKKTLEKLAKLKLNDEFKRLQKERKEKELRKIEKDRKEKLEREKEKERDRIYMNLVEYQRLKNEKVFASTLRMEEEEKKKELKKKKAKKINKKRVTYRKGVMRRKDEKRKQMKIDEIMKIKQKEVRLERIRDTVRQGVKVKADKKRLLKGTKSFMNKKDKRKNVHSQFPINFYTSEQIMRDPRSKLLGELEKAGLLKTAYAGDLFKAMSNPRKDMSSSVL